VTRSPSAGKRKHTLDPEKQNAPPENRRGVCKMETDQARSAVFTRRARLPTRPRR
jgi:hypothetical protein